MGRNARKVKRTRPNKEEQIYRRLCRWEANAHDKLASDRAIKRFVEERVKPYRERGDIYLRLIDNIIALDDSFCDIRHHAGALPGLIKLKLEHLEQLQTKLNYDDMRAALQWVCREAAEQLKPWRIYDGPKPGGEPESSGAIPGVEFRKWIERLVKESGAIEALNGAPASDVGKMRTALQVTDFVLTQLMESLSSNDIAPSTATAIWKVIHESRKALSAAPDPDELETTRDALELTRTSLAEHKEMVANVCSAVRVSEPIPFDWPLENVVLRGCQIIGEVVSLRFFLAEAEGKVVELRLMQAAILEHARQGWESAFTMLGRAVRMARALQDIRDEPDSVVPDGSAARMRVYARAALNSVKPQKQLG